MQTQLRQEIKDKFVNKSEAAEEFLTKKDLSNMENNMKVFDEGAKTIDLKLTNEMKKVQSDLKTITDEVREDANVQVKDLERKLANCETAMTSQSAKFERCYYFTNTNTKLQGDPTKFLISNDCHSENKHF